MQSAADTLPVPAEDTAGRDSVLAAAPAPNDTVAPRRKSGSPLADRVTGSQQDSLVYDVRTGNLYMYRKGVVKYTDMQVEAEKIRLNLDDKNVEAQGDVDTLLNTYIRPKFIQDNTTYELDSVRYNIDTKKALIWGAHTKEGEGIISGGLVKKMPDDVLHMKGGTYTTCDADHPHFYLQMTKGTVEPKKKVVFGPAYMVIEDVPFYLLGLPFGFFPQQGARHSGFILPQVGEEVVKGFFLRDGGYYFVFNDYVDLKLTAGIYTLGSWEAGVASNYRKRYKFSGGLQFNFAKDIFGEKGSSDYVNQQNMQIRWTHQQDPKFRPNSTFSASVNYSTSKYNKYNATDMNDYLSAQTSSSVAYSKNWAGKPFSLSINASHSQSMRDSTMSLTLPTFVFNVTRINPFRRRAEKAVGKERWYEKIAFTFQTNFSNSVTGFKQNDFMKKAMFDKMKFGFQHQLPVSASFNVLKYLNVTPGFSYRERWYFRKIYKDWNPETERIENTDTTRGFYRVYDYSASLSANTRLYGSYELGRKGKIKLRHVMTPNISFNYAPNFGKESYGYYRTIQSDKHGGTTTYSPFADEMYRVPGNGESMNLSFGINNTLEMKVPSTRDTSGYRKIKIFEAFNITSGYNFLADSLKLSPFSVNVRTTLFKGLSLNVNATFDPYMVDQNGRRIDRFVASHGKGLARLTSFTTGFSYGFSSKARKSSSNTPASNNPDNNSRSDVEAALNDPNQNGGFFDQTENQYATAMRRAQMLATQYYDFSIPWSFSFNYNFSFSRPGKTVSRMQTVSFNGSVNLTEKWAVEFGAGYDFEQNKITPGTVMIRRDMHCLQATFSWVPVGFRQSWTFSIRAKSSVLSDLVKYKKTNSFIDNYYSY
ncbi:putative LPS assembly protein LptD [uncultured Rikenella sp.]|uniref:putative LPS assembly protein LptD n=1 Tax=uncultured Rikenella sp. TaxID=368003 RepID=UPI002619B9AA|nr:putative LPS assembly protein LptD [uncultured Rikenella sp.]